MRRNGNNDKCAMLNKKKKIYNIIRNKLHYKDFLDLI